MVVGRRLMMSAASPATRAPKKVPQDMMEVISDFCDDGRPNFGRADADGPYVVVVVGDARVERDEVRHCQHAGHPARVIAEEDSAERGKGADEVRLDGDGRLRSC